jgi:hypothetical protein
MILYEDDVDHAGILSEAVEALLVDKSFFNQELHRFNKLIQVIGGWMDRYRLLIVEWINGCRIDGCIDDLIDRWIDRLIDGYNR